MPLKMLRSLPANQNGEIPAIALTAYTRDEDRTRVLTAGFQKYMSKPTHPTELAATICELVQVAASKN